MDLWNIRGDGVRSPLPSAVIGGLLGSLGIAMTVIGRVGEGLGLVSVGVALGLGGWSLHLQKRAERFDFLEANSDLFENRKALGSGGGEEVEWVTWGSTIVCRRAKVAREAARPEEREAFLRDFAHLVEFTNGIVAKMESRAYRQLNHLLICCRELEDWDEVDEGGGEVIVDALSTHLGTPSEGESLGEYIRPRIQAMEHLKDRDVYDEAFDQDVFLEALRDQR